MKALSFLIIICLPPVLFLSTFLALSNNLSFWQKIYSGENLYKNFRDTNEPKNRLKDVSLYLKGSRSLDSKYFSNQAIVHMSDVKKLFNILSGLLILTIIIFIASTIMIYKKDKSLLLRSLKIGALTTIYICVATAILFLFNFSYFFEKIHLPFFSNDLWMFEESDNLIRLFPLEFFISFTKYLFFLTLFGALLIYTATKLAISHDKSGN